MQEHTDRYVQKFQILQQLPYKLQRKENNDNKNYTTLQGLHNIFNLNYKCNLGNLRKTNFG